MEAEELIVRVDKPWPLTDTVVSVADYGADTKLPCNYQAFQAAIDACRDGAAARLLVPAGTYRFDTAKTLSFHDLRDVEIDGGGSLFVFGQDEDFVAFSSCIRVVARNFAVDWDWSRGRLASVAHVVGVSPRRDYVDLEFREWDDVPADIRFATLNAMDPERLTPGCEGGREFGGDFAKVEKIGRQTLRCHADLSPYSPLLFHEGQVYLVRHYLHDSPAFTVTDCRHLSLQELTVYSAPGAGFVVGGDTEHWEALRCRITLREGEPRRITTTSDGMHIRQTRGFFRLEDCDFSFHGDDCLNIHDNITMGVRDRTRNGLVALHINEVSTPVRPGDTIEFRRSDLSPTGVFAVVEDADFAPDRRECALTFRDPIPSDIAEDSILFYRRFDSSHFVIRNNFFHENRARGALIQASHGVVEGNRFFRNQGAALQIETGASFGTWSEGMGVEDVVVRDNSFESCDVNDWGKAVIYISAFLPAGETVRDVGSPNPTTTIGDSGSFFRTRYPIFRRLRFEKNRFIDFPRRAMIVTSCRDVVVSDNSFENPTPRRTPNPERGSLWIELSSNVTIRDNSWAGSPHQSATTVECDPDTTSGIVTD